MSSVGRLSPHFLTILELRKKELDPKWVNGMNVNEMEKVNEMEEVNGMEKVDGVGGSFWT